jgi:hypothetical protein
LNKSKDLLSSVAAVVEVAGAFLSGFPATISVFDGPFLLMLRAKILIALAITQ